MPAPARHLADAPRTAAPRGEPAGAVVVRQATIDDLAVVVRLRVALLREHRDNLVYGRLRADAADRARGIYSAQLQSDGEAIFLAERAGEAVGILRCVESYGSPLLYPARYGYLSSAYVIPPARRQGVLRGLLAAAEAWCRARGLREMRLHNASDNDLANVTWDRFGFEPAEILRVRRIADDLPER